MTSKRHAFQTTLHRAVPSRPACSPRSRSMHPPRRIAACSRATPSSKSRRRHRRRRPGRPKSRRRSRATSPRSASGPTTDRRRTNCCRTVADCPPDARLGLLRAKRPTRPARSGHRDQGGGAAAAAGPASRRPRPRRAWRESRRVARRSRWARCARGTRSHRPARSAGSWQSMPYCASRACSLSASSACLKEPACSVTSPFGSARRGAAPCAPSSGTSTSCLGSMS